MLGLSELAIILIVVIAFLCAKKLPELARSAGKSARILKAEARAMKEEEQQRQAQAPAQAQQAQAQAEPQAPAEPHATGADTSPRVIQGEVLPASSDHAAEPGGAPRQSPAPAPQPRPAPPSAP
ncbi:twin-arginine translocase TatA/TatE family subunit [Streptomyces abyssomicinicus]|uniref:twin-arginine translocase TatA/TatE family subunit n=1 Tax=Streptomyces abyssomicinicus TaxID=574929 RepID=UPI0012503A10|nr:twin-arginine translocase TatA/TatE family subunit [Streptomyces abyssomicinicus]